MENKHDDAQIACGQIRADYGAPNLARWCGIERQAVYQWDTVPIDRVATIAEKTGMTKLQIRPDREDLFGD